MSFGRVVTPAVAALGIAVSLSPLAWWDYLQADAWTLGFALWQLVPFALLLLLRRRFSDAGTAITAVLLALLTVLGQVEMSRDDSSTAVLGFIWFPIWYAGLVLVAWPIDAGARLVGARLARRGSRPA